MLRCIKLLRIIMRARTVSFWKTLLSFSIILTCRESGSQTPDRASLESHLPLIAIDTWGEEIPDEPKVIAWLKVIDNGSGKTNDLSQPGTDYEGYTAIEIRGQSSQMFPKKSYSFELRTKAGADTSA